MATKSSTPQKTGLIFTEHEYHSVVIALPNEYQRFIDDNFKFMVEQIYDIRIVPDLGKYSKLSSALN